MSFHGMLNSPEYNTWRGMKKRCYEVNGKPYRNYGGRGIIVCSRWIKSFENFYADMGPRPSLEHSLDRKDSNGNYEPGNCRWATDQEQNRNRRNNRLVNFKGESVPLSLVAEVTGIGYSVLFHRLKSGMSEEDAFSKPVSSHDRFSLNGESKTIRDWAKKYDLTEFALGRRLRSGLSLEEALKIPITKPKEIEFNGQTKTVSSWSAELGISVSTINNRLNGGESFSSIVANPPKAYKLYALNGETKSANQWAIEYDRDPSRLSKKMRKGISIQDALGLVKYESPILNKLIKDKQQNLESA